MFLGRGLTKILPVLMTVAVPVLPCTTFSQRAVPATLLCSPVVCRIPDGQYQVFKVLTKKRKMMIITIIIFHAELYLVLDFNSIVLYYVVCGDVNSTKSDEFTFSKMGVTKWAIRKTIPNMN